MIPLDRRAIAVGIVIIVAIAAGGSLVASSSPDGLERVATDLGFEGRAATSHTSPMPDYTVAGLPPTLSGAVAGLVGAGVVGGLALVAGRLLAKRT